MVAYTTSLATLNETGSCLFGVVQSNPSPGPATVAVVFEVALGRSLFLAIGRRSLSKAGVEGLNPRYCEMAASVHFCVHVRPAATAT